MNAKFDLSVTSQSSVFFEDLKIKASEKLIGFSKKNKNVAKFMGLPIGLCLSLLDLAQAVSSIGESLIKGIANIFGSLLFFENCSFSRGVKQIFLEVPLKLVIESLELVLGTTYEVLGRPLYMYVSPTASSESIRYSAEIKKEFLEKLSDKKLKEEIKELTEEIYLELSELGDFSAAQRFFTFISVTLNIKKIANCMSYI